jgi:hypothetical protein
MSKIARYQGNVRAFASDAQGMERTVFGGTNQADDLTSQITASFLRGWGIVGASEHPSLEDFNAAMYAMSQFIAYQHQMGVPEWHAEQEYHIGSICTHNGESYQSLQNANIGSQPPSAKWTPVLTSKNGLANLQLGDSTDIDPGDDIAGKVAVFTDGVWKLEEDHRGQTVWSTNDGRAEIVDYIGEIKPDFTTMSPSTPFDIWDCDKWVTDTETQHAAAITQAENERERLLKHADDVMLDWRTELMLGEISDANRAKLSAWMTYKNEVKSVDVTTDPERVNWPVPPEA